MLIVVNLRMPTSRAGVVNNLGPEFLCNNLGIRLIEDSNLTVTKSRVRTARERWLSWPWKPWRRLEVWQEPAETCYMMDKHTIVCHPYVANILRKELDSITIPTDA